MNTLFVTVSGRAIDLYAPTAADIHFPDIAEQLAKEPRYNGATPGTVYSVAQHLCLGADYIVGRDWVMTDGVGKQILAGYYLLHDAPEAYLKDDTTPKKRALDRVAAEFGNASDAITRSVGALTERFDDAIHKAAGLYWQSPHGVAAFVEEIDRRMLVTEWLQLRPDHPLPLIYAGIDPLKIEIDPWPWENAQDALLARMYRLLPVFAEMRRYPGEVAFA